MIFPMENQSPLGIIAGNGAYPFLVAKGARQCGVSAIHIAAFENETTVELAGHADSIEWMRVGQLGRLLKYFEKPECDGRLWPGRSHQKISLISDPTSKC